MSRNPSFRLPIGGLVGKALSIYFGNLLPFLVLAAICFAPWIAMRFYLETAVPSQGLILTTALLSALGTQVLTGALTYGVVQRLREQPVSLGQIISFGVRSFLRVLVVGLVVGLATGIGSLLLVVPGLIVMTCLYVAVPAAVLESKGVGDAIRRSLDLTRGNRWQVFGAVLLFFLVVIGGGAVVALMATGMNPEKGLPAWLEVSLNLVLAPIGATLPAVCYYMLRRGKESVDPKEIAAVFD